MRVDDFVKGDAARGAGQSSLVGTESTNAVNTGLVSSAASTAKNMIIGGTELDDVDKMYQAGKTAVKGSVSAARVGADLVKDTADTAKNTVKAVKAGFKGEDIDLSGAKSRSAGNLKNGIKNAARFGYREGKHALIKDSELEDVDSLYQEVKVTTKVGMGAAKGTAKGTVKAVKTTAKGVRKAGSTIKSLASKRRTAQKIAEQSFRNMQRAVYKTAQMARAGASALGNAARAAGSAAKALAISALQSLAAALQALAAFVATPIGIVLMVVFLALFLLLCGHNNTSVGSLTGDEAVIAQFLKSLDLDDVHVAAIMGNFCLESGGSSEKKIYATADQGKSHDEIVSGTPISNEEALKRHSVGGKALGIGQWDSGRRYRLVQFANNKNKNWFDLQTQLEYFRDDDEWPTFSKGTQYSCDNFLKTNDLETATKIFCKGWERCGTQADGNPNGWSARISNAKYFYEALTSGGSGEISGNASQKDIVKSAQKTPTTGANWCAAWVTKVFINAGYKIPEKDGNAKDMYNQWCHSDNKSDLKVGMIVADSSHAGTGDAGLLYGHVGIYIGNNQVMSNEGGPITTKSLDQFIAFYGTGSGVKWGWYHGIDLSKK